MKENESTYRRLGSRILRSPYSLSVIDSEIYPFSGLFGSGSAIQPSFLRKRCRIKSY